MTKQQSDILDTIYEWMDKQGGKNMADVVSNIIDGLNYEIDRLERENEQLESDNEDLLDRLNY